jgi:hypothetical protein
MSANPALSNLKHMKDCLHSETRNPHFDDRAEGALCPNLNYCGKLPFKMYRRVFKEIKSSGLSKIEVVGQRLQSPGNSGLDSDLSP